MPSLEDNQTIYLALQPFAAIFSKSTMLEFAANLEKQIPDDLRWADVALELACQIEAKELDPS